MHGWELRQLRRDAGISQKTLARLAGTFTQRISIYEQGHRPVPRVAEVAFRSAIRDAVEGREPVLVRKPGSALFGRLPKPKHRLVRMLEALLHD